MSVKQKLQSLFDAKSKIDYEGFKVGFYPNAGINAELIGNKATVNGVKLPNDYLDFLQFCDGCDLFKYGDMGGFWFLGTSDIYVENQIAVDTYGEYWGNNLITFCESHEDYLVFKVLSETEYLILDGYHDDIPANWRVIGHSFYELLEKIIDSNGKKFWLDN